MSNKQKAAAVQVVVGLIIWIGATVIHKHRLRQQKYRNDALEDGKYIRAVVFAFVLMIGGMLLYYLENSN